MILEADMKSHRRVRNRKHAKDLLEGECSPFVSGANADISFVTLVLGLDPCNVHVSQRLHHCHKSLYNTYLWRVPSASDHFLQHHYSGFLLCLAHADSHVRKQRVVTNVGSVAVTEDVGSPFVLGGIGVACTDVTGLQSLEILEGAKFVGHCECREADCS